MCRLWVSSMSLPRFLERPSSARTSQCSLSGGVVQRAGCLLTVSPLSRQVAWNTTPKDPLPTTRSVE